MPDLEIAVILGGTRQAVADWVVKEAKNRSGAKHELVDSADYSSPHLDEVLPASWGQYSGAHTKAWATKIASYDGFVFVTPEYTHSTSGVPKNAIDYLYAKWNDKAAAFVSYGALGGSRAIEHLRGISAELQIADVRQQLSFSLITDFENFIAFHPAPFHQDMATLLCDQLEAWAGALKPLRISQAPTV